MISRRVLRPILGSMLALLVLGLSLASLCALRWRSRRGVAFCARRKRW